jgi:hypothetical protein
MAEELLEGAERCYLWRLRMPFQHVDSPRNYLSKLLRYERLLEVTNSLSNLDEYVAACLDCWRRELPYGTYNLTNPGSVTTREVVAMIRQAGLTKKSIQYFESEEEFLRTAARAPRVPSFGVTRSPSRSSANTRFAFYIRDGPRKSDLLFGGIETSSKASSILCLSWWSHTVHLLGI